MAQNPSSVTTGIVANLLVQATATPIDYVSLFNQISVSTSANNAVVLPVNPLQGIAYSFRNDGVANLQVFPALGAQINSLGVNNSFSVPAGDIANILATSQTQWWVQDLVASPGLPISAPLTALAGGGQPLVANMIPAQQNYTQVGTVATAMDSIALPDVPEENLSYLVINNAALTMAIWPGLVGHASIIDNLAANSPVFLGANARMEFVAVSNTAGVVQWYSKGYMGNKPVIPIITTAGQGTMTPAYNNCLLVCSSGPAANVAMSLPGLAFMNGFSFELMFQANATHTIVFTPAVGAIFGGWVGTSAGAAAVSNDAVTGIANATLTFAATALAGDYARVWSDGVKWYAQGTSRATAGITMP